MTIEVSINCFLCGIKIPSTQYGKDQKHPISQCVLSDVLLTYREWYTGVIERDTIKKYSEIECAEEQD